MIYHMMMSDDKDPGSRTTAVNRLCRGGRNFCDCRGVGLVPCPVPGHDLYPYHDLCLCRDLYLGCVGHDHSN